MIIFIVMIKLIKYFLISSIFASTSFSQLSYSQSGLPVEAPQPRFQKNRFKRKKVKKGQIITPLKRYGLKIGINYAYLQFLNGTASDPISGLGYEGHFGRGYDLAYYPIFLEWSIGYGYLFSTADKTIQEPIHSLPIRFGIYHRNRTHKTSLIKTGLNSSMSLFYQKDSLTGDSNFSLKPLIGPSIIFETGNILFQLDIFIRHIQKDNSYLIPNLLFGFRF